MIRRFPVAILKRDVDMPKPINQFNRRQFLTQSGALAAAAFALPYFVPGTAFGANEKIHTGHIGVGRQGTGNLKAFLPHAIAVCDVDQKHVADAQKLVAKKNGKCEIFGDFRKLLEMPGIDAVVISTPEHWHALPAIAACEAKKDAYCEKPLTLFVAEGRKMVDAARRNNCIVQTGSQQRSDDRFRLACELVRSGRLGKIEKVEAGIAEVNDPGRLGPDTDPPKELDYEFWIGPSPYMPYNEKRVHYNFRFWWNYAGGQVTNWGAHMLDITQWALDADSAGPLAVEAEVKHSDRYEVFSWCKLTYDYPNGVKVYCSQDYPLGVTFYGEKGRIFVDRRKITSEPGDIIKQPLAEFDVRLYASTNHVANFLDCIKTRKPPICDVEIGHRSVTVCHLGNIAGRLGRKIRWDAAKEQIPDDPEANAMLLRPYRAPWKLA
jgi:predicted dehydrogenase